ncbi:MAG: TldD/PmbA family protein [Thermosynechococcaceae cyanobacterium MS004]|nr:TldD/PmbA family protein [Thermosynechococcaceae cyanobacterium MS004]
MSRLAPWEDSFEQLCSLLLSSLTPNEQLSIDLAGEHSHFMRLNHAKVRQAGTVTDGEVTLRLIHGQRTATASLSFTGNTAIDSAAALDALRDLRQELPQLPEDPYLVLPQNYGSSHEVYPGQLLSPEEAPEAILPLVQGVDFTGIYGSGEIVRANANSAGQRHWFATETFFLDYSMIAPSEKAVKATIAGQAWDADKFQAQVEEAKVQLQSLDRPVKTIAPGRYRTYLAPAAIAEILGMFSWGAISESSLRQGGSALAKLREGKTLSPKFTLSENFSRGTVPRFNSLGEIAPEFIPVIEAGKLTNTLVNARTAKEYGVASNGASSSEGLRAPEISPGTLSAAEILAQLDTGLYLSNLHYLNWSDRVGGRITGMTRYACFWVEQGKIVAPIQDLRFDDSLYTFLGQNLEAVTDFRAFIADVDTYGSRSLGGALVPGMLIRDFTFTL